MLPLRQNTLSLACILRRHPRPPPAPGMCVTFTRVLHSSTPRQAIPLPITAHGLPPKPPKPAAGAFREVIKKRLQQRGRASAVIAAKAEAEEEEEQSLPTPSKAMHHKSGDKKKKLEEEKEVKEESLSQTINTATAAAKDLVPPPSLHLPLPLPPPPPAAHHHRISPGQRFWKETWVKQLSDGSYLPYLDSRPLKTPHKHLLTIPHTKPHLAHLIAHEWASLTTTHQAKKVYLLPLTQLAARAVDLGHKRKRKEVIGQELQRKGQRQEQRQEQGEVEEGEGEYSSGRQEIVDLCIKYLDTDTLLCLHPPPDMPCTSGHVGEEGGDGGEEAQERTLRNHQLEVLAEVMGWIEQNLFPGIVIHPLDTAQGFLPTTAQPNETKARIRSWIEALDDWELVGLERCVVSAKSLLVGIRLVSGWAGEEANKPGKEAVVPTVEPDKPSPAEQFNYGGVGETWGIEEAARAATLEVSWQTSRWGEVEDTHDVEKEDVRRGLGAGWCLVVNT